MKRSSLPAAALALGSALGCAHAAQAGSTAAGTSLSNTATATYADPNNPGQSLNATSNTVSVTVAQVAGLTVAPAAVTDTSGGGSVLPGHVLNYDFLISNVGNAPTEFFIPGAATITGPATAGALQYSTDGGTTYSPVPSGGLTTGAIPEGGSVRVRQIVTVTSGAPSGAPITVLLGSTGPNDNSAGTQNQPYPTAPSGGDVYTVDVPAGGTPVNGEREASASEQILVGAQPEAFAAIHLTRTGYTPGTPLSISTLTYGLDLAVEATAPSGAPPNLVPADLAATSVTVDGSPLSRVLISDAIPAGTTFTGTPTAPSGWTPVYTVSPTTTTANAAAWTTTPPATLSIVTRIGFIAAGPVPKGTDVTGFAFQVLTTGANPSGSTTVADIAQAFGQSAGDAANALVYDESGNAMPSNFNDNGSPGSSVPRSGVAAPAGDGIDSGNNDTGAGAGGQDNVFTVAPPGAILNGPQGQPGAVGPTDNNDDFTDASAPVPAGTAPGNTVSPPPVAYTDTLNNPGATTITNTILLVPQSPSVLPGGSAADLPSGTTVTLKLGSDTAVYTYNSTSGAFTFTSGTAIQVPSLAPGASVNYQVTVALPSGTALSTDTLKGYPVPIRAFVDANANGLFDAGEASNLTVDRVFTGYLKVTKMVRIVDTDGVSVVQNYTATPTSTNLRPGRFLDYQITYVNIATPAAGVGNVLLNAGSVTITEDGTTSPNTWALDQDHNGVIDTSNVVGSAVDSGAQAVISFFSGLPANTPAIDQSGATAATDVTRYLDTLSAPVASGQSRTFTFRRKIN